MDKQIILTTDGSREEGGPTRRPLQLPVAAEQMSSNRWLRTKMDDTNATRRSGGQRKPPLHLSLHTSGDEWMEEAERTGRTVRERDSPVSSGLKRSALCWAAAEPDQQAHRSALLPRPHAAPQPMRTLIACPPHCSDQPSVETDGETPNRQTEPTTARGGRVLKQLKTSTFYQ